MNPLMQKSLEEKQRMRRSLVNLPFSEKVALLEKMRERRRIVAASPLRRADSARR